MDKLLEFGRRAMFLVRVLSGYEERRIRTYRLQLQKRIEMAQKRKVELRRVPEQVILSEVRRMVEEMQGLNRKLAETEAAIEEYFKPLDNHAQKIMDLQLEKDEKRMKEMMKTIQEQAMLRKEIAERQAQLNSVDTSRQIENTASSVSNQEQAK